MRYFNEEGKLIFVVTLCTSGMLFIIFFCIFENFLKINCITRTLATSRLRFYPRVSFTQSVALQFPFVKKIITAHPVGLDWVGLWYARACVNAIAIANVQQTKRFAAEFINL